MNRGNELIKTPLNYREGGIHILRLVNGYLDFIPPQLPPAERVAHQTGKMSQPKVAVQRSIICLRQLGQVVIGLSGEGR